MATSQLVEALIKHINSDVEIEWADGFRIVFRVNSPLPSEDDVMAYASILGQVREIRQGENLSSARTGDWIELTEEDPPSIVTQLDGTTIWIRS